MTSWIQISGSRQWFKVGVDLIGSCGATRFYPSPLPPQKVSGNSRYWWKWLFLHRNTLYIILWTADSTFITTIWNLVSKKLQSKNPGFHFQRWWVRAWYPHPSCLNQVQSNKNRIDLITNLLWTELGIKKITLAFLGSCLQLEGTRWRH